MTCYIERTIPGYPIAGILRKDTVRANEALDWLAECHRADIQAGRSHRSALVDWACGRLCAAGVSATREYTLQAALNGHRLELGGR